MSEQLDFSRAVRINPGEHDLTVQTHLKGVYQLSLSTEKNVDTVGAVGEIIEDGEVTNVSLILPSVLADNLPWPHEGIKSEYDETTGDMYYTSFGTQEDTRKLRANRQRQRDNLKQPAYNTPLAIPQIEVNEAATIIESYEPEEIFMLSGSGIGGASVWTHPTLARRAGFIMQPQTPADYAQNKMFANDFLGDPSASLRVKQAFSTLQRQRREALPTSAHYAFSGIVKHLGDKSLVATTNTTYAHEQTGLVVPWIVRERSELGTQETNHGAALNRELERRAKDIGLIVAIGIAADGKKIMSYVKEQNPDAAVLALNTTESAQLPYLEQHDVLVPGDCQKTLPDIYHILTK